MDGAPFAADLTRANAARRGEEGALASLVSDLAPVFARLAGRRARRPVDAEDLAAAAMARVLSPRVLNAYSGSGPLVAFLAVVGERAMIAICRTRSYKNHQDLVLSDPAAWPAAQRETASVNHAEVDGRVADQLQAALASLPARAEQIVRLKADGYGDREIANAIGLPVGTVKSTYSRARVVLRKQLQGFRPVPTPAPSRARP